MKRKILQANKELCAIHVTEFHLKRRLLSLKIRFSSSFKILSKICISKFCNNLNFRKLLLFNQFWRYICLTLIRASDLKVHIVYNATYAGQRGRSFAQCLQERKSTLTNAHVDKFAVAEHTMGTGHKIDWHMRSQLHPLNPEEGILPHIYNIHVVVTGNNRHENRRVCLHPPFY